MKDTKPQVMMESYQVLHMESRVSIAAGLNRHITRQQFVTEGETVRVVTWVPANADTEKTPGNKELVRRKFKNSDGVVCNLTIQQAVDRRIKIAGVKPRKGQATCLEIIFSGSHDRMTSMSRKELLRWAKKTLKWAKKTWGKENVVSATLHVDEKTPHIHMIVVPIVSGQSRRTKFQQDQGKHKKTYNINHDKLRLCMNEVYTRGKLYGYHDSYAEEVSKEFGMERGVMAEPSSKVRHEDSIENNREWNRKTKKLEKKAEETQALIDELTADYDEKKTDYEQKITKLQTQKDTLSSSVKEEQEKFAAAEAKTKEAEDKANKAEKRLTEIITKNTGIINKQVADFNAREKELATTRTEINTNQTIISGQKDKIDSNQEYLEELKNIKDEIARKEQELQSLSSLGLLKMIMDIPKRILAEIQKRIKGYWKGDVTSYEEVQYPVGDGPDEDFAKINIKNGDHEYFIKVREETGHVYLNGSEQRYRWKKTGEEMMMPELAAFFRAELTPEAKQYVESLYKKPTQAETVWQSKQVLGDAKIIKNAENDYTLKTWDRDFKKWVKVADCVGFSVQSDGTYDYITVTLANGKNEYYNQFGNPLTEKQRRRQGLGGQNTGGGLSV